MRERPCSLLTPAGHVLRYMVAWLDKAESSEGGGSLQLRSPHGEYRPQEEQVWELPGGLARPQGVEVLRSPPCPQHSPPDGGPMSTAMASSSSTRPMALENFWVPTMAMSTSNCRAPTMP